MSQGISASGSIGYVGEIMAKRNNAMSSILGTNIDHKTYLGMGGLDDAKMLQTYENGIEGNEFWGGNNKEGDLLSWGHYYNDAGDPLRYNEYIYQGQSSATKDTFTEIDFTKGTYKQYGDEKLFEQFFTKDPTSTEKPFDFATLSLGSVNFYEYNLTNKTGENLSQIGFSSNGSAGKRNNGNYFLQSVNPFSPESNNSMEQLLSNASMWMGDEDLEALQEYIKSGDQESFMTLFRQCLGKYLDPGVDVDSLKK